jgi:transposase
MRGRVMVDEILARLSRRFDSMYASAGRPSIPPEKLLRAQLLQMPYSICNERLLMLARHLGCASANELQLAGLFSVCE